MSSHADLNDKVARRTAVFTVVALTAYHDALAVVDARRYRDRDRLARVRKTRSVATAARILYNSAGTVAGLAGHGRLELHTAQPLRHAALTGASAGRAGLGRASLGGTRAAAVGALCHAREDYILFSAEYSLFKIYRNGNAYIVAAHGAVAPR